MYIEIFEGGKFESDIDFMIWLLDKYTLLYEMWKGFKSDQRSIANLRIPDTNENHLG